MTVTVKSRKLVSGARILFTCETEDGEEKLMLLSKDDIEVVKLMSTVPSAGSKVEVLENTNPSTGEVNDTWVTLAV